MCTEDLVEKLAGTIFKMGLQVTPDVGRSLADRRANVDRRQRQRVFAHQDVSVECQHQKVVIQGEVRDLSLRGAHIIADQAPAIGEPILVGRMKGYVVRHTDYGFAIEFEEY